VFVAAVVDRWRDGWDGGSGGSEEAKEANGENVLEVEGQWRRGGSASKIGFRVQG
jgi:hypothetical protein